MYSCLHYTYSWLVSASLWSRFLILWVLNSWSLCDNRCILWHHHLLRSKHAHGRRHLLLVKGLHHHLKHLRIHLVLLHHLHHVLHESWIESWLLLLLLLLHLT